MRIMEAKKGNDSALVLTIVIKTIEELMAEGRQAKEAILDWRSRHGNNCRMLMLTIIAPQAFHRGIEEKVRWLRTEEAQLAPILEQTDIEIMFLTETAAKAGHVKIPASAPRPAPQTPPPAPAKPWWKFW